MAVREDDVDADDTGFEEMGLDPRLLKALSKRSISIPTPIQLKAIPLIMVNKRLLMPASDLQLLLEMIFISLSPPRVFNWLLR
jgi:hypothetical protein